MYGVKITGIGQYLPPRVVNNSDLAKILSANRDLLISQGVNLTSDQLKQFETDDQWIRERTGIKERRIADPSQATSDLAVKASQVALQHAGLRKEAVEFVVLATVSPDYLYSPPTGAVIQQKMGLSAGTTIFDVSVACSSFIHALAVGYSLIRSGLYQKGLVIGADKMSTTVSWHNRDFSILLGDGAGTVVLEQTSATEDNFGPNNFYLGADGSLAELIIAPAGGSKQPLTAETIQNLLVQPHKLWMNGNQVFKRMVKMVPQVINQALTKAQRNLTDIDLIVFHQANLRIIEAVMARLQEQGLRSDTIVYNNIDRVGNTTSAAIPLCLSDAYNEGKLIGGMNVMAVVFGGGMTWATSILKWPNLPEIPV